MKRKQALPPEFYKRANEYINDQDSLEDQYRATVEMTRLEQDLLYFQSKLNFDVLEVPTED